MQNGNETKVAPASRNGMGVFVAAALSAVIHAFAAPTLEDGG